MADAEQPVAEKQEERNWFARNWWWVLLLIILACFALCGGVLYKLIWFDAASRRASDPYQMAMKVLSEDVQVTEKLGEPIQDTWSNAGYINETGDSGEAKFFFPVSGSKEGVVGRVEVFARRIDGKWGLTVLKVIFPDEEIDVPLDSEEASGGLEEAPLFTPPGTVPANELP
jgi:hypothetical protein